MSRVSVIAHEEIENAAARAGYGQTHVRRYFSGDCPLEWDLVASHGGSGCREKCGKAGEERKDNEIC